MSPNTILAGNIIVNDLLEDAHSIMFRHSNGLYYFIDSSYGAYEYPSSLQFFNGLKNHIRNYYNKHDPDIYFIIHASNTRDQLFTLNPTQVQQHKI